MVQINVGRTIKDTDESGAKYAFVIADTVKLMSSNISRNDEILIPVSVRDNHATFWEYGGRCQNIGSSIGTIITNNNDKLLDAILFNKLNRTPNGKQSLMPLRSGYRLYVGKISFSGNALAPKIRIVRLTFYGIETKSSTEKVTYGKFVVDEIFTEYKNIKGCFPAERLVEKLFSKDVLKPYFANGWSISNILRVSDKDYIREQYTRLMNLETPVETIMIADQFLDAVENSIVAMDNQKLSAVFQCIDFESGIMVIKPLSNIVLSDIMNTIGDATADKTFTIPIENMATCYNTNILFNSPDIAMLEKALQFDEKYAIYTKNRTFSCIRGYRG